MFYEEINKYNTDPNDDDSDDDHIIDGDEVKLGLKPDSDKSNGSTYDYERTFDNKMPATSDILSNINDADSPYEVSIDIKSAGNVDKALSVYFGDYSNASEDERIIGKSISFAYDDKLSIDSAKIYFKPKEIDGSIENYMLFQFFPETNYLLPVETKYTKDSAYVETNELGTFCLVDTKGLIDSKVPAPKSAPNGVRILGEDIKVSSNDLVWDYTLDETEVLFYIDISNCATDTIESTKQSILDFSEALFEHCDNAAIQIIGYDLSQSKLPRRVYLSNSQEDTILVDLSSVEEAIEKIETDTEVNDNNLDQAIYDLNNSLIQKGLFSSGCKNRYVFITSDSTLSLTQNYTGYWYNGVPNDTKAILEEMSNEGIHVNTLFSDNLLNNSRVVKGIKYYKDACDEFDFGVYTKSSTGYFGNTGYARIYSDAVTDIQSMSVMYACSVSPNAIPSSVERNAFINSLPPSYDKSKVPAADSNGNISFKDAAVKVGAATLDKNGNLVFKNMYNACDESDLTRKGYEQLTENMEISRKLVWDSFQITPFSDKILYNDDDGDGIPNKDDPYPDEPFDERFEIVSDFSYEPFIDFVDRHYKNSQECYDLLDINNTPLSSLHFSPACILVTYLSQPSPFQMTDEMISELIGAMQKTDFGKHPERENDSNSLKHASYALRHYFSKSGTPLTYDSVNTCELISSSVNNIDHLHRNLSYLMDCSEEVLCDNNTLIIAAKGNSELKAACFDNKGADEGGAKCMNELDFHTSGYHCNYVHRDWQNTVGESFGSIVAEVSRNGNTYKMKYRYYFMDIYEWALHYEKKKTGISRLHYFHELGLAQEYLINGSFEGTITWNYDETAYYPDVAKQIEETLKSIEGTELWEKSNEYERFYDNVNSHYTKKWILGEKTK